MKVACWSDHRHGPALVFLLDAKPGKVPRHAVIRQWLPPGVVRQFLAKGRAPSWEAWTRHLAGQLPLGGEWSVEEVPDGLSPRQALGHLRDTAAEWGLTQANPTGSIRSVRPGTGAPGTASPKG